MAKLRYERPIIRQIDSGMPNKTGIRGINYINQIDGVAIKDLIRDYGSPLFVVSERTIQKTYNDAVRAFSTRYPKVQFAWSYKTNYNDAVCRIFHKMGSWAEVVSGYEYDKAIANGVDGSKIIFNGPDKSVDDLTKSIQNNSYIHIDNFDELYTIIELSKKLNNRPKVAIRVNMNCGIQPIWDKFGFNYENGEAWEAINRIMLSDAMDLVGLHTHIGTYITVAWAYTNAVYKLADLAFHLRQKFNHNIKYIDMGGGFASKNTLRGAYLSGTDTCPTFDDYADAISVALMNSNFDQKNMPTLILETGRALIDDAGSLLGTVLANKRLSDGRRSMIIDTGVNIMFTAFWYDHVIMPAQDSSNYTEETCVYGPLCMNIDVIRPTATLPLMRKGDNFVIVRVGAYNMTQWMQFITYRPAIVLIDMAGKVHLIRKRENMQSITDMEQIPEYLA